MHDRLKWAREQAGFATAADAARHLGVEVGTYRHHENGTRHFRMPAARRYATAFGVDITWLLTGQGQPKEGVNLTPDNRPVQMIPLISWVQAGKLAYADIDFDDAEDRIPFASHRKSLVALRVNGTSMNRVAPHGSRIIVDYDDRSPQDGKLYVVVYHGETTFKRYRDTNGPARLEPDSTDPHDIIFPNGDFEVVGRVIAVVMEL